MCLAALVLLFLPAPPSSQAPSQPPTFGAAVEIVRLDVIVLDRDGRPVAALTRDDFVVEEGGRPQAIESFEPVVVPSRPVPPVAEPPRVTAARVRPPAEGRAFYVFFDDAHVTATPSEYVRVALRKFVRTELREGDWITVMAPQQGLWWTARNAWEYRQLEAVVGRLKGHHVRDPGQKFGMSGLSDFQAMCLVEGLPSEMCGVRPVSAAELGAPTGGGGGGAGSSGGGGGGAGGGGSSGSSSGGGADRVMAVGRSNPEFLAEEVYSRARRRIDATLVGLRQALDSLVPLRGHKSLLLISEGFVLIPDMPGYAELVDTARRANVAVHFLDPRGLESGYGEEAPPGLGWATKRLLDAAGADDVAGATGGRTIVSNDPGEGLRRIAAESEAYYLLGYQPAEAKAGERKVKVRVKREGLSVRARSRYYVEAKAEARRPGKEEAGHTPEEAAAMQSLADTTDLPLRVATLFFGDDGKGDVATLFAAEVDDGATAPAKRRFATVVEARPRDGGKAVRDEYEQEVLVAPGVPTVLSRQWQMPPGVWQLRLLARDTVTGRIGTAIHTFEVPRVGGFRLSTPILTATLEKADGRDRPRLSLDRTFRPGQVLYCQYQALGATADPAEKAPRVAAGWELRRGDVLVRASPPTRIRPGPDGRLTRLIGVSLDGLEPGDYGLVLGARDEVTGAAARAAEPFRVGP
jgi:VWFA-related protein